MNVKTPILPSKQTFAKVHAPHELNLEAICIFLATGFFLDNDTFWKDRVCLSSAHTHTLDENGLLTDSEPWFEWHYSPRDISFETALEEYKTLLAIIMKDQLADSPVILPLSGGLDSRSQAMILKDLGNPVQAYSYSFSGGYPEHKIAKQIAAACNFSFQDFHIPKGYLWDCIDDLAEINGCYSEFTHPRQMAILQDLKSMNGIISLGHWGDVLFDRGVPEGTQEADLIPLLFKKMVKKDGFMLAEKLWKTWGLQGDFKTYFIERIETSLSKFQIDNLSAKVRAFKTSQWAHRWTTTNLSIFDAANPIQLPYYDNRMCEFICTVPEEFLADRRLQIAHLKQDKELSKITWQDQKPFNLINYHYNKMPFNLPYRVFDKLKRERNAYMGKPLIQRNFELQFLGTDNDAHLKKRLFADSFLDFIPKEVVEACYHKFKQEDYVQNSHSVSMLLTLSLWHKHYFNK